MGIGVLSIRPGGEQDLPTILTLMRACVAAMVAEGIEQWDDLYPTADLLRSDIEADTLYVGALDATVVGIVVLNDFQYPQYAAVPWQLGGSRIGVVNRLMIAPHLQGQRLAREFMNFVEHRASDQGYDVLRLTAYAGNPRALRLYRGLGYRDAGPVTFRTGVFRGFEKRLGGGRLRGA